MKRRKRDKSKRVPTADLKITRDPVDLTKITRDADLVKITRERLDKAQIKRLALTPEGLKWVPIDTEKWRKDRQTDLAKTREDEQSKK